ncbi:MAG: hypothetical protein ACI9MR_000501 [Myxococcota bacterium]|jgi:hypothetical protein
MNALKRLTTAASVAAAVLMFAAPTASAQFGGLPKVPKIPGTSGGKSGPSVPSGSADAQRKRANKVNSLAQKGSGKIPGTFRSGYEKLTVKLAKGEDYLRQCDELWGPDLAANSSFAGQKRRYEALKNAVVRAHKELACLKEYEAIKAKFDAREVPDAALLDAFAAAAAKYQETASEENARHAKWWASEAEKMRDKAASLGDKQSAQASKDAARAVFDGKNDALDTLYEMLGAMKTQTETGEPIDQALFDAYEAAIPTVEAFNPTARAYFDDARVNFDLYNAWLQGEAGNAIIAEKLGAKVAVAGRTKGKKQKLKFKTKKNHCYLRLERWIAEKGDSNDVSWQNEKTFTPVQRFYFRDDLGWNWVRESGFCTNKAMTMTEAGKLAFAGTKNGLRYLVLEWSKEEFPLFMAQNVKPVNWDKCDPQRFYNRWANSIPGLVAYEGEMPILLGSVKVRLKSRAGHGDGHNDDKLSSVPPKKVVMRKFNGLGHSCWSPETTGGKLAQKHGLCERKIYQKYNPKFAAANKSKDRARTIGALKAANKKIDRLSGAQGTELHRKCEPIQKKIKAAMSKQNDRLFDLFSSTPPPARLDVVKHLIEQAEGTKRPLKPNGKIMTRSDHDSRRNRRRRVLQKKANP